MNVIAGVVSREYPHLTPEQVQAVARQHADCIAYGSSFTKMSFDAPSGTFGLAPIKLEGAALKYDPTRPQFPPQTWRDRLRWRLKRAQYRIRRILGLSVP